MTSNASRYSAEIDLRDVNDPHILAIGRVPANSRVLDLGAADGSVAATLVDMGCRVWGIEVDPVAANKARESCVDVVVEDLNGLDLAGKFGDQKFDVVLMLDILEHLMDPVSVLGQVAGVLDDGGWGVMSLPNVAHLSVRLQLMAGRFTYRDTGLLDRTHLRFFDRQGVAELLADSGWEAFDLARVTRRLGSTEIDLPSPDREEVRRLESDIDALTYQYVITGAPIGTRAVLHPPVLPAAVAQSLALELASEVDSLQHLSIGGLRSELEAIRSASTDRRRQLLWLLVALQENSAGVP